MWWFLPEESFWAPRDPAEPWWQRGLWPLLGGLSLLLLSLLIIVEPRLLALLVAGLIGALGVMQIVAGVIDLRAGWRERPRRIRVKVG